MVGSVRVGDILPERDPDLTAVEIRCAGLGAGQAAGSLGIDAQAAVAQPAEAQLPTLYSRGQPVGTAGSWQRRWG
jgi:hypothetical protein